MPMVSVIIPTYNRAGFIAAAIESVLRQSFKDVEIIVIDDGSTDNTSAILKPYYKHVVYIPQANTGVSAARNAGILQAKGDWIAFLDSDDEWLPEYLAYQMDGTRRHARVRTHITNSLNVLLDGRTIEAFRHNNLIAEFRGNDELLIERPLHHVIKYRLTALQPTIVHHRTLLKAGLFDHSLSIAEDYDVICRMALMGPFRISRTALASIYRRRESTENLTSQLSQKGIYSFESFAKVHSHLLKGNLVDGRERIILRKVLSSDRRAVGNLLLRCGKGSDARRYFREALYVHSSVKSIFKYLFSLLPAKTAFKFVMKGRDIEP
jgi:glycosyltransferase involved in cell wall biosynthesis